MFNSQGKAIWGCKRHWLGKADFSCVNSLHYFLLFLEQNYNYMFEFVKVMSKVLSGPFLSGHGVGLYFIFVLHSLRFRELWSVVECPSKSNQYWVHYLSCQAVTRTEYLNFCSGRMLNGRGLVHMALPRRSRLWLWGCALRFWHIKIQYPFIKKMTKRT